jgi:hypothetical protein
MRFLRWVHVTLALAVGFFAWGARGAAVPGAAEPPLKLSAFVVNADRVPLKWGYIAHRDFEVLTLTSDKVARKFAEQVAACMDFMNLVVPEAARLRMATPVVFILDPEGKLSVGDWLRSDRGNASAERGSPMLTFGQDGDTRITHIQYGGGAYSSGWAPYSADVSMAVLGNLYPALLAESNPRPSPWLVLGLHRLIRHLRVKDRILLIPRIGPLHPLVPLGELPRRLEGLTPFGFVNPEAEAALETCAWFASWGLFAEDGKFRSRFWNFYLRAALDPKTDETFFQSCFGMSYAEALPRIAAYRAENPNGYRLSFPKSRQAVSPSKIRDATPGEIARVAGEWGRLMTDVFGERLRIASGQIFDRGLSRSPVRDPRLVASAGIYYSRSGRDMEALPLLEEATKAGVVRPQAYLELARIRLAAARARPEANGKLSSVQVAGVMELLRGANAQSDQQEKYYELLVSVWENVAPEKPNPADLASLAACARIFTRRADLTLRSAQLHAGWGYLDDASRLSEEALRFTTDERVRSALTGFYSSSQPGGVPVKR